MLIDQEKMRISTDWNDAGAGVSEPRHRTKMNKGEFPELIATAPVYPGVDRLCRNAGGID